MSDYHFTIAECMYKQEGVSDKISIFEKILN